MVPARWFLALSAMTFLLFEEADNFDLLQHAYPPGTVLVARRDKAERSLRVGERLAVDGVSHDDVVGGEAWVELCQREHDLVAVSGTDADVACKRLARQVASDRGARAFEQFADQNTFVSDVASLLADRHLRPRHRFQLGRLNGQ